MTGYDEFMAGSKPTGHITFSSENLTHMTSMTSSCHIKASRARMRAHAQGGVSEMTGKLVIPIMPSRP
jgi:hypothetical protein